MPVDPADERPAEPGADVEVLPDIWLRWDGYVYERLAINGRTLDAGRCDTATRLAQALVAAQARIATLEAELSEIESRGYANLYANELHEQGHQSWMHVPDARRCWCHGHAEAVRP